MVSSHENVRQIRNKHVVKYNRGYRGYKIYTMYRAFILLA